MALANDPHVLFCDEPTGELDTSESHEVYGALQQVNETHGTTVVVVTHDPAVTSEVRRTIAIRDGRTASETLRRTPGHEGEHVVAEEFAVLDRAGRLQLHRFRQRSRSAPPGAARAGRGPHPDLAGAPRGRLTGSEEEGR